MKRVISITLAFMLLLLATATLAEAPTVPINFEAMSTEELIALSDYINSLLVERGVGSDVQAQPEEEAIKDNVSETMDRPEGTETISEGATNLTDDSFLEDLAAGLCARWGIPDQDTSVLSDKQMIEYYSKLVNAELSYVEKYNEYSFTDEKLGDYAHNYINALQSQFIAITEFYGKDEASYTEYWGNGYRTRGRYIYLINKAYGLNIPSKYADILKEMVEIGIFINTSEPIEAALQSVLSKSELELSAEGSKKYIYVMPFNITNTSSNDIAGLSIKVNFINDKDVVIDTGYLLSYENVAAGKTVSTQKVMTDDHFTHVSFTYSFNVNTGTYYDTIEGEVVPDIQYAWDGTIKKNGELAEGQPVLEIENLVSNWEMNTSWNKSLYVPTLKFDVRNNGTGEADRVTVRCVFTNVGTKEIWDEETTYVIGSSDSPLKPGYSKKAFVYSSVGYKTRLATTPELTVDIYINDQLVGTTTIK